MRSGTTSARFYRRFGKRLFDIAFVLLVSPAAISLTLLGVLLALASGGRPFYVQPRVGLGGKMFTFIKIRSMVAESDAVLDQYLADNPDARREWDHKQKLTNDPRITRFGGILRRTSLDEVPQLWNVLKGDMSIVGPRPMMPSQRALYPGWDYDRLRPGITGPWQISDRSQGSFAARAAFDTEYFQKLSLWCDLRILWHTVGAVLRCTGQ